MLSEIPGGPEVPPGHKRNSGQVEKAGSQQHDLTNGPVVLVAHPRGANHRQTFHDLEGLWSFSRLLRVLAKFQE